MSAVRFNAVLVRKVADAVEEFAEGVFSLQDISSGMDNGPHYNCGNCGHSWRGAKGAREACMYFIGGALEAARIGGRPIPDEFSFLKGVHDEVLGCPSGARQNFLNWEESGREFARHHVKPKGRPGV